jgi:serine/threonine protein phosphatase PrpC
LQEHLLNKIDADCHKNPNAGNYSLAEIQQCLFDSFIQTNLDLTLDDHFASGGKGGSTAVVGVVYPTLMDNGEIKYHLTMANSGDSRGVLCCSSSSRVALATDDHKPDRPDEMKRIEDLGGFVTPASAYRIARVGGVLATSRSFGDLDLSPYVIPDPEFFHIELATQTADNQVHMHSDLHSKHNILILASDGLWDVFTSQQAVDFVHEEKLKGKSPFEISEKIVAEAYRRRSGDNITVLIVFLDALLAQFNTYTA